MKTIYTLLVLSVLLMITLLVASFLYLEKTSHENYYYLVNVDGIPRGDLEIDEYTTEKNIIYKSKINLPYEIKQNKSEIRFELDKKTMAMKIYEEINSTDLVKDLLLFKKDNENLAFLAVAKSKFAYLNDIKIENDAGYFDRQKLLTMIPFIKLYNFKRGGSQSFECFKYGITLLPPSRTKITLTSIRDEYIDMDGKKIKTEVLVVKCKDMEEFLIWVSKKNHQIISIEIPDKKIHIKRTANRKKFLVRTFYPKDESYISQKITFTAKNQEFASILMKPQKEGTYPAVILLQGEDASDSANFGMYLDLSDYLAKNGYVVMRFDPYYEEEKPRFKFISIEEEHAAIGSAISLLETLRFVDTNKICMIAHADANYIVPALLKKEKRLKAWIMLSPRRLDPIVNTEIENIRLELEKSKEHDKSYTSDMARCQSSTLAIAKESPKSYSYVMGTKVFVKRISDILNLKPFFENFKELKIPILALQGKKDDTYSIKFIQELENNMKPESGENRTMIFFRNLGHYFGDIIKDQLTRNHYSMDKEVLETITGWLNKYLKEPQSKIENIAPPDLTN